MISDMPMNIYYVLFTFLLILSIVENKNLFGNRLIPVFLAFLSVLIFTSIRGDVGQDTSNYLIIFDNLEEKKTSIEAGFYFLNKTVLYSGAGFNTLLFFVALISLSFYFYSIYKFLGKGLIIFAFMIIFCDLYIYFNISGIRQGIALSIVLLSGYYAYEKSKCKFLILIMLASLFHITSIVALLLYPIINSNVKFNLKNIIIISVLIVIWTLFIKYLMANPSLLTNIHKGANIYLSSSYNKLSINSYILGTIRRGYPILLAIIFFKNIRLNRLAISIFKVYLVGFIIYLVNYPYLQDIAVRISSYFIIFEPILVVLILNSLKVRNNARILMLCILCLAYYRLSIYANLGPYQYHLMETLNNY